MQRGSYDDSHMLQQAGVVVVSHSLCRPLTDMRHMQPVKCLISNTFASAPRPQKPTMCFVPHPHLNPRECWLAWACRHRYNRSTAVPTLTAHVFAVSGLPVLETGLSGTKSRVDLGERTCPHCLNDHKQEHLFPKAIFLWRGCQCYAVNKI